MQKSCWWLSKMLMLQSSMSISIFITFCLFTSVDYKLKEQNRRGGGGDAERRAEETPKQGSDLSSVICTHSKWKIEVILRMSVPKTIFNRKKYQIIEKQTMCVCVSVCDIWSVSVWYAYMCMCRISVTFCPPVLSVPCFYMHFCSDYRDVMNVRIY